MGFEIGEDKTFEKGNKNQFFKSTDSEQFAKELTTY
jgi:hypothetical protein